jgi:uncharacterized protein with von Willebrand factor type A (vWA) domain
LFSAARSELKHLEHYYFHNCLYEGLWKDNRRRWTEQIPTHEVLRTYGPDWKCIFVGDAAMSPYEVAYAGGASEHWNEESGEAWLRRAMTQWPSNVWINPMQPERWAYTQSIGMIRKIAGDRMFSMTLEGLDGAMKALGR